ncbi:MAG: O-antigen ligase family protein [Phycisphaerales bacterium]|nr:O-antigen ligase family protein [Phycisphaerales bacterium]
MPAAMLQPAPDRGTAQPSRPAGAPTGRPAPHRATVNPTDRWLITGFLLVLLAPPEAQFSLGSLVLSPQRVFLMLGLIPAMARVVSDRRLGARAADAFVVFHALWAWVALVKAHGITGALQPAGSYTIEFFGSYLVGRALTLSPAHLVFFTRRFFQFIIAMALLAFPEMITGRHFIRDAFGMIFSPRSTAGVEPRFGLTRAFGPFDHPILYGVFCASALGFVWYLAPTARSLSFRRLWRALAVVCAAFASLSTGPLMACSVQCMIIGWDVATRAFRGRWWILLLGMVFAYVAIDALSNRDPMTVFISYATFNPQTGYDRKLIWDIGSAQVRLTPAFGIGMNAWTTAPDWWPNTSVDNFWLLTAMRYGLPGVGALLAVALLAIYRVARLPYAGLKPLKMGWLVSFIGLSIAAVTVHLWGSAFVLFGYLLGMGVSLGHFRPPAPTPTPPRLAS